MAKHSSSLAEHTRTSGGGSTEALIGELDKATASKNVVSILFLSLGETPKWSYQINEKIPTIQVATVPLTKLMNRFSETVKVKKTAHWNISNLF